MQAQIEEMCIKAKSSQTQIDSLIESKILMTVEIEGLKRDLENHY